MRIIAILAMCFAFSGCQKPVVIPASTVRLVRIDNLEQRQSLWSAAQDELREGGYPLALTDWRSGRLESEPQSSQHFFEFWRKDVATNYDLLEASIMPIRRQIKVSFGTVENPDPGEHVVMRVEVSVQKEKLSRPDRQFNQSGVLFQFFGTELPSTTGQTSVGVEDDRWISAGRDPAMESYWLERILRRSNLWHQSVWAREILTRESQDEDASSLGESTGPAEESADRPQ